MLPCGLHHHGRNAETNGGRRCEGKQRHPHGTLSFCLVPPTLSIEPPVNAGSQHPFLNFCSKYGN
jgi:hypothetical protein